MLAGGKLSLRLGNVEDAKLIANNWLESYKSANLVKKVKPDIYYRGQRRLIADLLDRAFVWVACDHEDPWTVWGWICFERRHGTLIIHYVYVKSAFRGLDIATKLVEFAVSQRTTEALFYTHLSRSGPHFVKGLVEAGAIPAAVEPIYDPYLAFER